MDSGLRFHFYDGTTLEFDPVEYGGIEVEDVRGIPHYIFSNSAYSYEVPVEDVEGYSWYDLCSTCGKELDPDCPNCEYEDYLEED